METKVTLLPVRWAPIFDEYRLLFDSEVIACSLHVRSIHSFLWTWHYYGGGVWKLASKWMSLSRELSMQGVYPDRNYVCWADIHLRQQKHWQAKINPDLIKNFVDDTACQIDTLIHRGHVKANVQFWTTSFSRYPIASGQSTVLAFEFITAVFNGLHSVLWMLKAPDHANYLFYKNSFCIAWATCQYISYIQSVCTSHMHNNSNFKLSQLLKFWMTRKENIVELKYRKSEMHSLLL